MMAGGVLPLLVARGVAAGSLLSARRGAGGEGLLVAVWVSAEREGEGPAPRLVGSRADRVPGAT